MISCLHSAQTQFNATFSLDSIHRKIKKGNRDTFITPQNKHKNNANKLQKKENIDKFHFIFSFGTQFLLKRSFVNE